MRKPDFAILVAAAFSLSAAFAGDGLEPRAHYGEIGRRVAAMLPRHHILNRPLDDEMSRRAWTNIVTFYDFDHTIFLKSDLEALADHELTLDDEVKAGDVSFGYRIHALYSKRLGERIAFATNLLATADWDFTEDEMYGIKRKDSPWPETREEAEDLWRKRIKNEYLAMTLVRELDAEKKAEEDAKKAAEAKSEPAAGADGRSGEAPEGGNDAKKDKEDDDYREPELTVEASLVKKYLQYYRVMTEPDEENVLQYYLSALCRAYDPHTDYLSPMSEEDFEMGMNLKLCGVGAVLQMDDGALKISEVMPGGPMDVDGRIKKGDKIVSVRQGDGAWEDVMWQPMNKTVRKIRGEKGTRVSLEIIPRGDPTGVTRKKIELVRDEIKLDEQAATGHVERVSIGADEFKLGYVYLPSFYGTMDKQPGEEGFLSCAMDVAKYLAEFNAEGVEGAVLDLRGNGGGSLKEAVMLSAIFSPASPVVVIQDKGATMPLAIPRGNPVAFRKPVVVLIDRASASAAEIVAGFLKDAGRAVVLGDVRTHGKGTVQTLMDVGRRNDVEKFGSIKITTARFYRINGDSTQVKGVESDVHLPSFLDHLDIGEDKLPNALPFTRLKLTDYRRVWNLNYLVPRLRTRSEARTGKDAEFAKHIANVNRAEEMFNRKELPLERVKRKKMMKLDREADENAQDDEEESRGIGQRKRSDDKDVVLKEAYNVLADIVSLTGRQELPQPRVNWMDLLINNL